jgi:hypothetical protein
MGENSLTYNSLTEWNFQKVFFFTDEFKFQLCNRPEKFACLSLKIRAWKLILIARFSSKKLKFLNLFSYRSSKFNENQHQNETFLFLTHLVHL